MQELESAIGIADKLSRVGAYAIMIFVFICLWRRWLVIGYFYEGIVKEKDEWKKLFLDLVRTEEKKDD